MKTKIIRPSILLFFLVVFVNGCQGCGPTLPQTAEETITTVATEIDKGNPEIIWQVMPPKYHGDVNEVVRHAANEMDPELWKKGVTVLGKVTNVVKDKKQFILGSKMLSQANVESAELQKHWDSLVTMLEVLLKSELINLDKLKQFDGEKFLAGSGKELFSKALDVRDLASDGEPIGFKGVKVKKLKENENEATLKVTFDGKTETLKMTRVDGRWIPSEVATQWDKSIDEARAEITKMLKEDMPKSKPMLMMMLAGLEAGIEQLSNAKTQTEFDAVAQGLLMGPMMQR